MRFLVHDDGDRLAALWRVYCVNGLPRGEVLALRWSDVDFEASTLRIERTLGETGGHLVWGTPKTKNGRRTLTLDEYSVAALRSRRARQGVGRLALGVAYNDQALVFCREAGGPIWPGTVSARFQALGLEIGLPTIHLHDLRHSSASLALAGGVDLKTVSSNLGHSGIAITADLYAHVLPATARAAADRVAEMVQPKQAVTNS
jgi:integrase